MQHLKKNQRDEFFFTCDLYVTMISTQIKHLN